MNELVATLLLWLSAQTGYSVSVAQPDWQFLEEAEIRRLFACAHPQQNSGEALALYDRERNLILLSNAFQLHRLEDQGHLLHELVHHLQDVNDAYSTHWRNACGQPDEVEAYALEARFLAERGASPEVVAALVRQSGLYGLCSPPYIEHYHREPSEADAAANGGLAGEGC